MAKPTSAEPGNRRATGVDDDRIEHRQPSRHWRGEFLAQLAATSNVTAAGKAANIDVSRAYKVRRLEPEFARDWRAALLEGYENLELEVLHRLRFGEAKEGEVKFDNAAALRLLGLHRETVARERALRENEDVALVRASIEAKLTRLRGEILARRQREDNREGERDGDDGNA